MSLTSMTLIFEGRRMLLLFLTLSGLIDATRWGSTESVRMASEVRMTSQRLRQEPSTAIRRHSAI